jgi:hypothetical protein
MGTKNLTEIKAIPPKDSIYWGYFAAKYLSSFYLLNVNHSSAIFEVRDRNRQFQIFIHQD